MLHDGQSSSVFFDVGVSHQFVPVPSALQHKQPWFDRGIDGGRGMHTLDGFTTEGEMNDCTWQKQKRETERDRSVPRTRGKRKDKKCKPAWAKAKRPPREIHCSKAQFESTVPSTVPNTVQYLGRANAPLDCHPRRIQLQQEPLLLPPLLLRSLHQNCPTPRPPLFLLRCLRFLRWHPAVAVVSVVVVVLSHSCVCPSFLFLHTQYNTHTIQYTTHTHNTIHTHTHTRTHEMPTPKETKQRQNTTTTLHCPLCDVPVLLCTGGIVNSNSLCSGSALHKVPLVKSAK